MIEPVRIVVADDHQLMRGGLVALIRQLPGTQVVGEAGDGREALRLVRTLVPDIVIMDIAMQELNGLEAAARIRVGFPAVKVIMLSMHASEEYVAQAMRAGVAGYLIKDAAIGELATALAAVARGETYLSPAISRQLVDAYLSGSATGLARLSSRQREVLQLIAEGHSTREIATRLHLSVKTVETHRAQIMQRLEIRDVASLTRFAISKGLVSPHG
ncbi:MAG: response regulator transcription factor [Gammaproteobacteria bacterium]